MEGTVKMENTVKTEESPCPLVAIRLPPSQSELLSHLPPLPPTPFPSSLPLEAASYSIPQKPLVHLARIRNPAPCLVIHWRVTEEDAAAPDMDSYSIYIAQESHSSSVSPSWRNVGVVKALALPMAVTVTKYQSGTTYVIVVGKDRYGRYGPYSDVQTVLLA
ncbi:activating transcription factor 7-interacting protein 1-like [Oncorhynchus clarkii lewisi]